MNMNNLMMEIGPEPWPAGERRDTESVRGDRLNIFPGNHWHAQVLLLAEIDMAAH